MNDTVIFAGKRTVVIIPTFNERDNIERVISAMDEATGGACDILFVDDNSPDGTGALIEDIRKRKPNVYAIHRAGKMGLGSAYIDGFRYAVRNGYEYMIEMDADLSHDPAYLPQMMRALESDDIVVASRFRGSVSNINLTPFRILASIAASVYMRALLGIRSTDPMGGFVGYNARVLRSLDYENFAASGYAFQAEVKYECRMRGFTLGEIPIVFRTRRACDSKISRRDMLEALVLPWKVLFTKRRPPAVLFLSIGDETVASSRARVWSWQPYLKKAGSKYAVLSYTSPRQCRDILMMREAGIANKAINKLYSALVVARFLALAPLFDVLYIQKVRLSRFSLAVLKLLNRCVIFDFDDSVHLYTDIGYLLKGSSCVVVSNDHLKKEAAKYNSKVYSLISPVDVESPHIWDGSDIVTVGWLGSPASSRYLEPVVSVFRSLEGRFGNLKIELMGAAKDGRFSTPGVVVSEWSLDEEKEFLRRIDIGIMPLGDDEWSMGKGGYKLLLYMASGLPCVASPVGVNAVIVEDGVTGFFARTPADWEERIGRLIADRDLRRSMGEAGRKKAKDLYSYEANAPKFMDILKRACGRYGNNSHIPK